MDLNHYSTMYKSQMSDAWHIPRASLGGSTSGSSNSSNKSHSNPPTVTRYSRQLRQDGHTNLAYIHNEKTSRNKTKDNNNKRDDHKSRYHNYYQSSRTSSAGLSNNSNNSENVGGIKRGSRSSQGSTDSNSSTHVSQNLYTTVSSKDSYDSIIQQSASSGSMLLTAANLERFVAIHNKQQQNIDGKFINNDDPIIRQLFNTNPEISLNPGDIDDIIKSPDHGDTVIGIDPNLLFVKTKDVDAVSIASSTHFTMVNGIGGPQKKIKEGICSRGHQITVLILSMSMFFLVGILAMVYLLEMRAREMPQ